MSMPAISSHDPVPRLEVEIAKLSTAVEFLSKSITQLDGCLVILGTELSKMQDQFRTDFRLTWAGLIVASIGLAGLMAHGFKWI
jgi:hypothetical protein